MSKWLDCATYVGVKVYLMRTYNANLLADAVASRTNVMHAHKTLCCKADENTQQISQKFRTLICFGVSFPFD